MKFIKGIKKLSTLTGWRQFFKILTKKERVSFFILLFLFFGSFLFLLINFYFENTEIRPRQGGTYIEGVVSLSPRFINPIYAEASNSDVDRDLVQLIFSGLMKYSPEGEIVPDLAEDYKILEEGKVYEFYLKDNLFWSNGEKLSADDVVFTIKTIQNPDFSSPLRINWLGVELEKISDKALRFKLKNPSAVFLENCTVKIIPEKVWKDIPPQDFHLTAQNLKPIGSGPFQLKNINRDKTGELISLDLVRNPKHFGPFPNLSQITFRFYKSEDALIEGYQKGEIQGLSLSSRVLTKREEESLLSSASRAVAKGEEESLLSSPSLKNLEWQKKDFNLYSLSLPRYFAVFFNLNPSADRSKVLSEKEVRQALNYGINKEEILKEILGGRGKVVESPILPEIYEFKEPSKIYEFNPEKAKEILKNAGFVESENACPPSAGAEGDCRRGKLVKIVKKEPAFQFKTTLRRGSQSNEVKELQKCLAKDPAVYPEGEATGYFGPKTEEAVIRFQEKHKEEILKPFRLEKGTGDVKELTRKKLNEICFESPEEKIFLKFSLTTVDQPMLIETASSLKSQWENLGAEVEIRTFDVSTSTTELEREVIKPRNYEVLLFGEVLGLIPDPFPFWHSSQKRDPGLNLAGYENKKCDKLLEEARQSLNETERKEKLEKFQELLIEDAPVTFLYNPDYLYLVSKEIKGIEVKTIANPSKRFSGIENWYSQTHRVWKSNIKKQNAK